MELSLLLELASQETSFGIEQVSRQSTVSSLLSVLFLALAGKERERHSCSSPVTASVCKVNGIEYDALVFRFGDSRHLPGPVVFTATKHQPETRQKIL
eukprot:2259417-Amphidinium_carterae.1